MELVSNYLPAADWLPVMKQHLDLPSMLVQVGGLTQIHMCPKQACALMPYVGFRTVITVPTVITPYSTVQITVGQNYGVRPYKTVPPYSTILTASWLFGSNFSPKQFFSFCYNYLCKHAQTLNTRTCRQPARCLPQSLMGRK